MHQHQHHHHHHHHEDAEEEEEEKEEEKKRRVRRAMMHTYAYKTTPHKLKPWKKNAQTQRFKLWPGCASPWTSLPPFVTCEALRLYDPIDVRICSSFWSYFVVCCALELELRIKFWPMQSVSHFHKDTCGPGSASWSQTGHWRLHGLFGKRQNRSRLTSSPYGSHGLILSELPDISSRTIFHIPHASTWLNRFKSCYINRHASIDRT